MMMFNRIRGAAAAAAQGAQATGAATQAGQGVAGVVAGQAGQSVQEAASHKAGKANVALGAAGLLIAGTAIAGIAIPTVIANKTKNYGVRAVSNPIAGAVGAFIMDGTSSLQRSIPAVGVDPTKNKNEYGFDL